MTTRTQFFGGMLSLAGLLTFSAFTFAEGGGSGRSGASKEDAQTFQQQRSDKTQQGQELINKQPMASQGSDARDMKQSTGADLSGGRDSHLGPHDSQGGQMQKKDRKSGSGTDR